MSLTQAAGRRGEGDTSVKMMKPLAKQAGSKYDGMPQINRSYGTKSTENFNSFGATRKGLVRPPQGSGNAQVSPQMRATLIGAINLRHNLSQEDHRGRDHGYSTLMFNQQQLRRSTKGGIHSDFHQNALSQLDNQSKQRKFDRKNTNI